MKNISGILKGINAKKPSKKKINPYESSGLLRTVHNTAEDFEKTEKLFKAAQESLAEVQFNERIFTAKLLMIAAVAINNSAPNFDEKTCALMKQIAAESEMREGGKKFLETLGINQI